MMMIGKRNGLRAMKLVLLGAIAATLGATALVAQGPPGGGQGRGGPEMQARQLEMMSKQLNLTPDQVTKVKAIQEDGMKQQMALRDDTSTPGPDKRTKMMAIREEQQTKIKAVLTEDQKTKYDGMMQKMRENREKNGGAPPPAPPATE